MTTTGVAPSTVSPSVQGDDESGAQRVVIYNCSRIGLTANPPGFSFADLFRFRRRRRC